MINSRDYYDRWKDQIAINKAMTESISNLAKAFSVQNDTIKTLQNQIDDLRKKK